VKPHHFVLQKTRTVINVTEKVNLKKRVKTVGMQEAIIIFFIQKLYPNICSFCSGYFMNNAGFGV